MAATEEHRRIRDGLMTLSRDHYRILELGWEPRQRAPELVQFFGENLVNLVMESQLVKDVRALHPSGRGDMLGKSLEAWLAKLCPKGGSVVLALREHAETVLQDALTRYADVRLKSRYEVQKERDRVGSPGHRAPRREQGIPFLMGGSDDA